MKPPKQRPRGNPDALKGKGFDNTPEGRARAKAAAAKRVTFSGGSTKISAAYTALLTQKVPKALLEKLGLDAEDKDVLVLTWSDVIAYQAARRAVGLVEHDKINFEAIKELRETTEGKTPDQARIGDPSGKPLGSPSLLVQFVKPKPREEESKPAATTEPPVVEAEQTVETAGDYEVGQEDSPSGEWQT